MRRREGENSTSKAEFALILAVLVFPPIAGQFFCAPVGQVRLVYSAPAFFVWLLSVLVYARTRTRFRLRSSERWTAFRVLVLSGEGLKCFGFLCVISVSLMLAGHFLRAGTGVPPVVFPDRPALWLNFFLGTLLAAFSEEAVYRVYLPESFRLFLGNAPPVLCEAAAAVLFALGHVYLGALGVANALACGIALRLCVLRTRSIWFSFAAHALYNFGVILFLALPS